MNNPPHVFRFIGGPSHGRLIAVNRPEYPFYVSCATSRPAPAMFGVEDPPSSFEEEVIEYWQRTMVDGGGERSNLLIQEQIFAPRDMNVTEVNRLWRTLSFEINPQRRDLR